MTRGAKWAIIVSWVALLVGGVYLVKIQADVNTEHVARVLDACAREQHDRLALRRMVVLFEGRSLAVPGLTAGDRPQIFAFYRGVLRIIPPINC
jgi:hypothetical protein